MYGVREDAPDVQQRYDGSQSYNRVLPEIGTADDSNNYKDHLQELILDQITKVQERQEQLDSKIDRLAKEQEEFYLSEYKKMDQGFKEVSKCLKEVNVMKEVFKEIVGVMTGDRVRFIDHSNENCVQEDTTGINQSDLLVDNMRREMQRRQTDWIRDRIALETRTNHRVKSEFENDRMVQQMYLQPEREGAGASEDSLARVPPEDFPTYRMNRAIRSVTDLAREYFEGLRGKPSVMSLERRFGSTWRNSSKERTFFHKRMCIINKINDVKDNPTKFSLPAGMTRKMAIKVVENMRLGNNSFKGKRCCLTLSQLYVYLSKKMDTPSDYSLELKHVGKTTRELITQARIRSLEGSNRESGNQTSYTGASETPVNRDTGASVSEEPPAILSYTYAPTNDNGIDSDSNEDDETDDESNSANVACY
ncbi:HFL060Wp [Eremothecium sinecaudum]|uniref:HFL060Wp n=1 Tax=Eremothecium sinecaudum TaxID=45286 RepID=A0A109UXS7_9SACH|nr:HFL060Wp [Eremothecium sinecaudum]AMD21796.1 HFL060Wp [Eremothecium sinecaudum]